MVLDSRSCCRPSECSTSKIFYLMMSATGGSIFFTICITFEMQFNICSWWSRGVSTKRRDTSACFTQFIKDEKSVKAATSLDRSFQTHFWHFHHKKSSFLLLIVLSLFYCRIPLLDNPILICLIWAKAVYQLLISFYQSSRFCGCLLIFWSDKINNFSPLWPLFSEMK